jgi:hypothetical protein
MLPFLPPRISDSGEERDRPHGERVVDARREAREGLRRHAPAHHPDRDRHVRALHGVLMASNKELTEQALALASELGVTVQTDGLKNEGLVALVASLAEQKAARPAAPPPAAAPPAGEAPPVAAPPAEGTRAPIDGAADPNAGGLLGGPPPAAPQAPPTTAFEYAVAPGCSIACARGLLNEGDEIRASDVGGGDERLAELVASGHVAKAAAPAKP